MSEKTVTLSAKILAVRTPRKHITAAERTETLVKLIERFGRQVLAEDRAELDRMSLLAQAIADKLPEPGEVPEKDHDKVEAARQKAANLGRNTPEAHDTVTDMFDRLSEMRLDWQAERVLQFGEAWIKAKTVVSNREAANGEFVDSGLNAKVDAYAGMPVGNKDERQAKLEAGFKLMDALRAPLGRCEECEKRGRKYANELAANTRTGKPFELCSDCYREKRTAEGPARPASQPAAADWGPDGQRLEPSADGEAPKAAPAKSGKRGKHGPKNQAARVAGKAKRQRNKKAIVEQGKRGGKQREEGRKSRREDVEGDE